MLKGKEHSASDYIHEPSKLIEEVTYPSCFLVTSSEDFIRDDTLKLKRHFDEFNIKCELMDWEKGESKTLEQVFSITYPKYPESQITIHTM